MTADPYRASAGAEDPGSWNRYAYVGGDPINLFDSSGLDSEDPNEPNSYCPALGTDVPPKLCPKGGYPGDDGGPYCHPGPDPNCRGLATGNPPPKAKVAPGSGTKHEKEVLEGGYQNARGRLTGGNSKCVDFFSSKSGVGRREVVEAFDAIEYRFLPLPRSSNGLNSVGAATVGAWTPGGGGPAPSVFLNTLGPMFHQMQIPLGGRQSQLLDQGTGLTGNSWTALLLLHELGHVLKVFGPDAGNQSLNSQNTNDVLNNCFSKMKGVWQ